MSFLRVLKEALVSINSNRTRSFLTILGIVIGVGSVIGLLAIGQGAADTIVGQIESIGTNVVYIIPGNFMDERGGSRALSMEDVDALNNRTRAPHIRAVAPVVMSMSEVNLASENVNTNITGALEDYVGIAEIGMAEGSFFSAADVSARASVVVIGPELAERLTGRRANVVGTTVRINDYPFRVIGVTEAKGGTTFNNPDLLAFIPISTMQLRVSRGGEVDEVDYILIQAQDAQSVDSAIKEAEEILRASHRLSPRQTSDFTITKQEDILAIANSITNVLTIVLAGIAGISLLVGGIGIMNIMLVSVTERTREIGLRKALGARKFDIMLQFLTESALLSLIGGLLGIGLGWLLGDIVGRIAANTGTPIAPVIGWQSVLLATLFSAAVGIFFGLYPAQRPANFEPVDALRYE